MTFIKLLVREIVTFYGISIIACIAAFALASHFTSDPATLMSLVLPVWPVTAMVLGLAKWRKSRRDVE